MQDMTASKVMRCAWAFKYVGQDELSLRMQMKFLLTDETYRQLMLHAKDTMALMMYVSAEKERETDQIPFDLVKIIHETAKWEQTWYMKADKALEIQRQIEREWYENQGWYDRQGWHGPDV